jgi:hypothetical protein
MYDMFFVGDDCTESTRYFSIVKELHPLAKHVASIEEACERSKTQMFWIVWLDSQINFDLNFKPDIDNLNRVHVWINNQDTTEVALFPKSKRVTKREVEHRYFVNSLKFTIPNTYDIAFISYFETGADSRYRKLSSHKTATKNRIFRIEGVAGIHNAHIEAAKKSTTRMIWVIDADAEILDNFNFDIKLSPNEEEMVHLWYSRNPVNGLEYGYGGIKLFPRNALLAMESNTVDMTTSITKDIKIIPTVASITHFNTDPLSTWRSAFRECAKLSSRIIKNQDDEETITRLNVWRFNTSAEPFAEYARGGASAGEWFGSTYKDNKEMLSKINDFSWLKAEFDQHTKMFPPETFK